jgi:hypothetical protein
MEPVVSDFPLILGHQMRVDSLPGDVWGVRGSTTGLTHGEIFSYKSVEL